MIKINVIKLNNLKNSIENNLEVIKVDKINSNKLKFYNIYLTKKMKGETLKSIKSLYLKDIKNMNLKTYILEKILYSFYANSSNNEYKFESWQNLTNTGKALISYIVLNCFKFLYCFFLY